MSYTTEKDYSSKSDSKYYVQQYIEVVKDILRGQTKLKKINALFSCQFFYVNG